MQDHLTFEALLAVSASERQPRMCAKVPRPGVYTVVLWAIVDGTQEEISSYSMFHGIEPP